MHIYEEMKKANIPIDHHESDLYVKVTPESKKIIKRYKNAHSNISIFTNNVDTTLWYDIPFAYLPFWERRTKGA